MKIYKILGKNKNNEWLPVSVLYPKLVGFKETYDDLMSAQKAKGWLKQFIKNNPAVGPKLPYTIIEL
jgi:hypothetical protein